MAYQLLTGATGLLGNYLLRDLLRAGRQVAVLVRSSRIEAARQRVESIMANWERSLGRAMPRPPVLEGDICDPDLGLDNSAREWVTRNCDSVIHNAASLSFDADEKTGEPRRSNVEGTRNVLDLCRRAGIRSFHHVSTAYVCGLRTGRVFEDELDVGQQSGNAYEQSKIEAEKLVRGASFIDSKTFYRPSIIIGDSITGYTTTFHGFYTPLKIVQALVDRIEFSHIDGTPLFAALGLSGQERKNYVPVDWVSRVITELSGRREHHGRTFHLTSPQPATVALMSRALEDAIREYVQAGGGAKSDDFEWAALQKTFTDQMATYQAYWRDDPDFDCQNTAGAAPHLPCPTVDLEMLLRTARFALKTNFGWPRPRPQRPDFDVLDHLTVLLPVGFDDGCDRGPVRRIGMQVNGPGGGQWTLAVEDGRPVAAQWGLAADRHASVYLNSSTFRRCVRGELSVLEAHRRGQIVTESEQLPSRDLLEAMDAIAGNRVRQPV